MPITSDVKKNSLWVREKNGLNPARVMAVAENYVMLRFPRCTPFVVYITDFVCEWDQHARDKEDK